MFLVKVWVCAAQGAVWWTHGVHKRTDPATTWYHHHSGAIYQVHTAVVRR